MDFVTLTADEFATMGMDEFADLLLEQQFQREQPVQSFVGILGIKQLVI